MARLGLLLIGVVAWASEQLSRTHERPAHYLLAGAAYMALAGVTVIGLAVDGLYAIPAFMHGRSDARVENRDGRSVAYPRSV